MGQSRIPRCGFVFVTPSLRCCPASSPHSTFSFSISTKAIFSHSLLHLAGHEGLGGPRQPRSHPSLCLARGQTLGWSPEWPHGEQPRGSEVLGTPGVPWAVVQSSPPGGEAGGLRVLTLTLPRDWGVPADVPPQPAPLIPNHANLQPFNLLADIAGGCRCFTAHISLRAGAGGPTACAVPATRAAQHGSRASLGWSSSEGDLQDLPELLCRSQPSTSD